MKTHAASITQSRSASDAAALRRKRATSLGHGAPATRLPSASALSESRSSSLRPARRSPEPIQDGSPTALSASLSPASTPSVRQVSVFAALKRLPPSPVAFVPLKADPGQPGGNSVEDTAYSTEAPIKCAGEVSSEAPSPSAKTDPPMRSRRVSFAKDTKSPKPTSLKELLTLSAESD
mmetsp:Transcript_2172/g.5161  ORF Transcript_2172/g.5161 Transcript_2172/m.5161 type:complete len:178 (+) Transcript_2172:25-558(+)